MNSKKAKQLRKSVYGDQPLRKARRYVRVLNGRDKKTGERTPGTTMNAPGTLRSVYQAAKRAAGKAVAR